VNLPRKAFFLMMTLCLATTLILYVLRTKSHLSEFAIGREALGRGEWTTVSKQIQRLRQKPNATDQIQFLRGGLLLRTGDPRGAIAELVRVRSKGELGDQTLLLLCEAFYQLKQWNNVVSVGLDLLRRDPDLADAHRWLGATYFDLGDMNQAEFHLKELARLAPLDYSPHRLLGVMHKDFEQFQEAIVDFRRSLELRPPSAICGEVQVELAKALVQQNQFDEALRALEFEWPATAVEPHIVRAECLWTLDRRDEAKRELLASQKLSPNDPQVLWMIVRMALDEERTPDALQTLQQIVDAEPTNHQALYEISLAYRRLGKEAEAEEFLERRNAARGLFERLVELNKQAIKEPHNADVRIDLANVCDQLGKKELAAVWRDAAAALVGDAGMR